MLAAPFTEEENEAAMGKDTVAAASSNNSDRAFACVESALASQGGGAGEYSTLTSIGVKAGNK